MWKRVRKRKREWVGVSEERWRASIYPSRIINFKDTCTSNICFSRCRNGKANDCCLSNIRVPWTLIRWRTKNKCCSGRCRLRRAYVSYISQLRNHFWYHLVSESSEDSKVDLDRVLYLDGISFDRGEEPCCAPPLYSVWIPISNELTNSAAQNPEDDAKEQHCSLEIFHDGRNLHCVDNDLCANQIRDADNLCSNAGLVDC